MNIFRRNGNGDIFGGISEISSVLVLATEPREAVHSLSGRNIISTNRKRCYITDWHTYTYDNNSVNNRGKSVLKSTELAVRRALKVVRQ